MDYDEITNDYINAHTVRGVLLVDIKTDNGKIPLGTEVIILKKFAGFTVRTSKCVCCGIEMKFKVKPHEIKIY